MSRQRLGQHFLSGQVWQRRILETLPRDPPSAWIEIGSGHGEMTRQLSTIASRVVTIETDQRLAERLRARVLQHPPEWPGAERVEVILGDVLKQDLGQLLPGRFRVFGNLPYYITSPILHHLSRFADRIDSIHIVIQFEVAARVAAHPGRRAYGYLSAACQFYGKPEIALRIPPGAFRPPPRVTSALLRMGLPGERAHLGIADEGRFLKFIQVCFGMKRKTLRNNLRSILPDIRVAEALAACALPADARAEQLTLQQFAALFSCAQQT
jgi:16S rRNA (adenine1518-N6/adenine1519-N6)-dimethyltransferase